MPLQIPHPSTALHLYRHLLREASYLPPLCRPWITSCIQDRYRDCQFKYHAKVYYIKEAHHYLRYLRSANAGHVDRILHLCYLATGRVGKRRRQLANLFMKQEAAKDTTDLEIHNPTSSTPSTANLDKKSSSTTPASPWASNTEDNREPDWLDNWSTDKLLAMARSQVGSQGGEWPHTMRRLIEPKLAIPTENSFGRPLTKKLARNKLKRHYSYILHQLLPPLPQGEWDRLQDLTHGRTSDPYDMKMPPRRTVAQPVFSEEEDHYKDSKKSGQHEDESWVKYALKPVRQIERGNSRTMKSLTGELDRDPRGQGRPIGVRRTLGSRRLRRGIYGHLFEMSSTMWLNPRSGKWNFKWGSKELEVSKPTKSVLGFFQGVDKDGNLPNAKRNTNANATANRESYRREGDEDQLVDGEVSMGGSVCR